MQTGSGAQPTFFPIDTMGSCHSCKTARSLPFSADVKTAWSYTSTPPHMFMAWYTVRHKDKFT